VFAQILECDIEFSLRVFLDPPGNPDSARLRKRLQTCRYVNAITPETIGTDSLNDEFAKVDAYSELETLVLGHLRIAFGHAALNLDGAAYPINDTRKFGQYPIACNPCGPTAVIFYLRRDDRVPMLLPLSEGAFLVSFNEPTVAGNIGHQNGRKPSLYVMLGNQTTPPDRSQVILSSFADRNQLVRGSCHGETDRYRSPDKSTDRV